MKLEIIAIKDRKIDLSQEFSQKLESMASDSGISITLLINQYMMGGFKNAKF